VIYAGQTVEAGPVDAVLRTPSHPYTRALLACHPERATAFTGIRGTVPSALRMPPGCRFGPRCDYFEAACAAELPAALVRPSGADVRCLHPA
jgi:oligopeptide/dipeptide ABC transporter ATP-binding protein